jgi:hypothetical protein
MTVSADLYNMAIVSSSVAEEILPVSAAVASSSLI